MSDVKDRAKIAAKEMKRTGWDRWAATVTDLLAELERVDQIAAPIVNGDVTAEITRLNQRIAEMERVEGLAGIPTDRIAELECQKNACQHVIAERYQRIAELEDSLKKVQNIAKSAMDQLPGRWNMGFQAGLKEAIPYEKELTNALSDERKARKDDNAAFTEDILRLEAENNRLNTLLHKASQKSAEDFTEFIKDARMQTARDCVEIVEKYPAFLFGAEAVGVKLNLAQGIKARFGLDG